MCIVHLHPGSLHCLWSLGPSASSLPPRCPVISKPKRPPGTWYGYLGSHSLTPHSIKTSQQRPEFHCRTWLQGSRWLDWLSSPSSPSALPLCFLSGGGPQVFDDDDDHELSSLPWFCSVTCAAGAENERKLTAVLQILIPDHHQVVGFC